MYSGGVDPDDIASRTGLPADLIAQAEGFSDCLVFPDVWPSVGLFRDMNTQWRVGPGGIVGLDYGALPAVMQFRGVTGDEMSQRFDDIQTMESAAIELIRSREK